MKSFKDLKEEILLEGGDMYPADEMTMKELKIACYAAQNILDRLEDGAMIQRWQISAVVKASEELASVYTSMSADEEDEDDYEDEVVGYEYPWMGEEVELDEAGDKHIDAKFLEPGRRTPKELKDQIRNVSDTALKKWGQETDTKGLFNKIMKTNTRKMQDKLVQSELRRRGITSESAEQIGEEQDYKVSVEGLPDMYVKANSPTEVKANLRKIVRKPDMVKSVDRVTQSMIKKIFRDKATGKEDLDEKLKASDDMGDWVKDFQDSDAPQFKGKSQKKRQQMAVAAKLSAERNEEVQLDEARIKVGDVVRPSKSSTKTMKVTAIERVPYMGRKETFVNGIDDEGLKIRRPLKSVIKEHIDLDEKYKDPWAAPRKGSSAWHAAQQRKKAERDPEEVKRVNAIGNKNHMVGTAKVTHNEAVEFRHDRYMRSHGKKASGGSGHWMFTHKNMGGVDYNNEKEVHTAVGKFADAKKSAQQWAKKHGHDTVYVMEEVEQIDEISKKTLGSYIRKASDQVSDRGFEAGYKAGKGKSDDSVMKPYKRGEKRLAGISKAVGKLTSEEVELDEAKKDHFVYQKGVPKTKEVVHRGTEQSSKDWIEKNSKFYGHKGKDFDIYKGTYPNVKPSDKLNYSYVAEEVKLCESEDSRKNVIGSYLKQKHIGPIKR